MLLYIGGAQGCWRLVLLWVACLQLLVKGLWLLFPFSSYYHVSEVPSNGWVIKGCFVAVVHLVYVVTLSLFFSSRARRGVALCFPKKVGGGVTDMRGYSALM